MKVQLRYFASLREAMGVSAESLDTSAADLAGLRQMLMARSAAAAQAMAPGRPVRMALDQVMCDESALLHEGCEVAFFPPVTGG